MRVSRWGNSLAVRIPQHLAAAAALREGSLVDVLLEDDRLVIRGRPAVPSLDELIARITPENRHPETDWGAPRGGETW